ncbi:outer-membrane lipoprotein carrier protein LolA [Azorhizobium sp. AG788]|uniref:outer-membrane lipoprotein carrier protein LolA n=1 Tax=Azorhizobium sp. AG788 TaxID=2183897 RepID=UPI00313A3ACC
MPRRLAVSFAILIGLAAAPHAMAQGILLPPGEVPGASVPGGSQAIGSQLFSPQPMVPQTGAPRAPQAAPAPSAAPQAGAPQSIAPAAQTPAAQAAVPLPAQRPASANQPRPPAASTAPAAVAAAPRNPLQNPAPAPAQGNLDRAAMTTVNKLTTYWNSVQTLVGTFVQIDSDGSRKTGDFYMQKPGKVRFEYNAPATIELVSNGQSVVVRDRRLNTQDVTPLAQTPLRFLLADKIELVLNPNVTGVYEDNVYVSVVMQEQVPMMGTYRLLLLFDAKDYQLRQWIVTDPQGYDTSVAISNLNYTTRPDPKLFNINFERMLQ